MARKRNPERRESTVKEFRAEILPGGPGNASGVSGPSVSTEINTLNQLYKSTSDSYQQKLAAAIKIKQMEQTGVFSRDAIDEAKKQMGISTEGGTVGGPGTKQTAKDLLMMQIANETDRDKQNEMIQTLANIETIEKSGGAMSPLMLNLMNRPQGSVKKNTFEEKLMDKLADHLFKEPKSELDNLDKIAELMKKVQEMQGPTDGIDKIAEDVKKYKEIGLVRDTAQSENEMKLEIEKLRIDNEYKIEEHKIEADKQRTDSLTSVVGDVIGSALSAAGAAAGSKGGGTSSPASKTAIRPETMRSSYEATCAIESCGAKILVTNIDKARDIQCPSCNQTYHLDSKDKKLYMIQESPTAPSSPSTA